MLHRHPSQRRAESATVPPIVHDVIGSAGRPLQRVCGPAAIGSVGGCIGRGGDIADFGGSSDRLFLFDRGCDELEPGEDVRVRGLAASIGPLDSVEIDGFASEEGDPTFNDNLSCARAHVVAAELGVAAGGMTAGLFKHGATPGGRTERRSAVVTIHGVSPSPAPGPGPTPATGCATATNADLWGPAFNPTTDGEGAVIAANPIDAFTVNGLADDSRTAATASGLAGPHLGPADAFRHCFWNCRMAQELGNATAEQFGTGHENSGPSGIPHDNDMDLHNNAMGRSFGTPGANCQAECMTAVTSGLLRTIRGPRTRPAATPPVPTHCIGPSDQTWP